MTRYFTSDWHLGSELVLKVCKRPFKNIQQMNSYIIKMANNKMKKDQNDLIYHVGDFMCYKNDRGYKGLALKSSDYLKQIHGNVILIKGNHDESNKTKCYMDCLITNIGPYKNVSVSHYPSFCKECDCFNLRQHSIHICGHVHGDKKWLYSYDGYKDILNINVAVDLWKYHLVSEQKLVELIDKLIPTLRSKSHIQKDM